MQHFKSNQHILYLDTSFSFFLKVCLCYCLYIFKLLFIFGCAGSLLLLRRLSLVLVSGATLCFHAWSSHCSGFSCCGAWALGVQASAVVACGLMWLGITGSVTVVPGLSYFESYGMFPNQESNHSLLH